MGASRKCGAAEQVRHEEIHIDVLDDKRALLDVIGEDYTNNFDTLYRSPRRRQGAVRRRVRSGEGETGSTGSQNERGKNSMSDQPKGFPAFDPTKLRAAIRTLVASVGAGKSRMFRKEGARCLNRHDT